MSKRPVSDWFDGLWLPRWLIQDDRLEVTDKLIFAMLCKHADRDDYAFPGIECLCAELGVSKNTVTAATNRLEQAGYIEKQRLGQGRTNRYHLTIPTAGIEESQPMGLPNITVTKEGGHPPQNGTGKPAKRKTPHPGTDTIRPWVETWASSRNIDLDAELEKFEAWTKAKDKPYADWAQAFRNHCFSEESRGTLRRKPRSAPASGYREQPYDGGQGNG